MNKQVELTDSIYGVIQYIKEQQDKQIAHQQYYLSKRQSEEQEELQQIAQELSQIKGTQIEFKDIEDFFPYLKNIEEQVFDMDVLQKEAVDDVQMSSDEGINKQD